MNLKWKYFTSSGQPLKERLTQQSAALRSLSPSLIKIWLKTFTFTFSEVEIVINRHNLLRRIHLATAKLLLRVSVWHLKNWPKLFICCVYGWYSSHTPADVHPFTKTAISLYLYQHNNSFCNKFWEVVTWALPRSGTSVLEAWDMHVNLQC